MGRYDEWATIKAFEEARMQAGNEFADYARGMCRLGWCDPDHEYIVSKSRTVRGKCFVKVDWPTCTIVGWRTGNKVSLRFTCDVGCECDADWIFLGPGHSKWLVLQFALSKVGAVALVGKTGSLVITGLKAGINAQEIRERINAVQPHNGGMFKPSDFFQIPELPAPQR